MYHGGVEAVESALPTLENIENAVIYGERVLYIQREKIVLYGKHEGFAYVCLDVKKKSDDITRIMLNAAKNNEDADKTKAKLKTAGIFVLLSQKKFRRMNC